MSALALALSALACAAPSAEPRVGAAEPRVGAAEPRVGAPAAAPREVLRSTAPLTAQPSDIPALKKRIEEDQREVQRTRAAVKKAQKGKNEPAKAAARQRWLAGKDRLKADRALLRRAIEAREAERREGARARGDLGQDEKPKP